MMLPERHFLGKNYYYFQLVVVMILRNLWLLGIIFCPYSISGFLFRHRVRKTCRTIISCIDKENGRSKDENIINKLDNKLNIIFFASSSEVFHFGHQIANVMDYEFQSIDFNSLDSTDIEKEIFYQSKRVENLNLASYLPDARISAVYIDPERQSSSASAISALASIVEKDNAIAFFIMFEDGIAYNQIEMLRQSCAYTIKYTDYSSSAQRIIKLLDRIQLKGDDVGIQLKGRTDVGMWTHFLSLTAPQVADIVPILDKLSVGVDALELRVDLLRDRSVSSIHSQIATLRDNQSSKNLKIVYTVRTKGQIGQYPDDDFEGICNLLKEGLRAGVEWLDVEACLPAEYLRQVSKMAKGRRFYPRSTQLLGSLHTREPQNEQQIQQMFTDCDLEGNADMLKVVTGAANNDDCLRVHSIGERQNKSYIGLCLGAAGAFSRVLNKRFTPVTHALLAIAAPGQLTVEELMDRRVESGLLVPRKYYLFGSPIQQSLSPAMHNGAFNALLLPHNYSINEKTEVSDYANDLNMTEFGGASVTIPHKESIIPYLDEVRGAAVSIGAVNTIVPEWNSSGTARPLLIGCNTDWLGMQRPILRLLGSKTQDRRTKIGLVVGAGGTARAACFAVKDLGLQLVVTNRSPEKAVQLAERFGGRFVPLDRLEEELSTNVAVVISTVPATANFTLPSSVLSQKPVILDVVYKPAKTLLVAQALAVGAPLVQGATMLLEQALEQFQLWHGRPAPRAIMEEAVFRGVERLDSGLSIQRPKQ